MKRGEGVRSFLSVRLPSYPDTVPWVTLPVRPSRGNAHARRSEPAFSVRAGGDHLSDYSSMVTWLNLMEKACPAR